MTQTTAQSGAAARPRRRRGLKWLWWGFGGLLALVLAAQMYLDVLGGRPIVIPGGPDGLRVAEEVLARAPRTMIVAAHPDDIEWYMGGTVARLVDAGAEVTIVMATNGEARSGLSLSGAALGKARQAEQVEAARRLGVTADVVFLGLPDAGLWRSPGLTARVREVWERVRPELVVTFDPSLPRTGYLHPDHLSAGRAVARIAREEPGREVEVWLFHSREPDIAVDITPTIARKAHALAAHTTQVGNGGESRLLSIHSSGGAAIGAQVGVKYAEPFRRWAAGLDR